MSGATGSAATSQTMVIEGQNSITLTDSTLTCTGTAGMMIYQSFSGDAPNSDATSSKATMTIALTNSTKLTGSTSGSVTVTKDATSSMAA